MQAVSSYRAALALAPAQPALHFNLANALAAAGQDLAALDAYDRALALDPARAAAHTNRGNLLRKLARPADALEAYRRALHADPASPQTRYNLGTALLDLQRPEEALVFFRQAARGPTPHLPAFASAGEVICRLGRPAEALPWFEAALDHTPGDPVARFGAGLCHLALGDFAQGWAGFEARLGTLYGRLYLPEFDQPHWTGEAPVAGRRMLLVAEQGFGDTIQFVRYAPLLRQRGAYVILQAPEALHRLLAPLVDEILAKDVQPPPFGLHCPLMSLPFAFRTMPDTVPADIPYLRADPALLESWRRRLGPATAKRIGVAFSGNPDHLLDAQRSLPAASLAPLLARPGCEFHLLQKDVRATDLPLPPGLYRHALDDFADTAALAALMDLVITVDTSIAHLAGALGRPTWTMVQDNADFRWMQRRADTPWYPSMRLFRQPRRGDWAAVLAAVGEALSSVPC